ncbi:MAG: fumarate hydratase [bacterium]|nr:fumarate hydratase [bacterium]
MNIRELPTQTVTDTVARLCVEANFFLGEDVLAKLRDCLEREESPLGKSVLEQVLGNAAAAREKQVAMCQDTGYAVVFLEIGQDVHFTGGGLMESVQEGVRRGYQSGPLRKSVVRDPLRRVNTGDNTPAIVHCEIVPGDRVRLIVAPKGGGSENMSEVKMLPPSAGREGVMDFVADRVRRSGPNPCPPVIVGVGLGGTFEKCAFLAKKSLLRTLGEPHPDPYYAEMESELLERVNALGIGPMGYGGRCTALAVHVEAHPCHIASLPVAVNIQCHAARHKEAVL